MPELKTRAYQTQDAKVCLDILRAAVRITGRQFYTPNQVRRWLSATPSVRTLQSRLGPSLTCRVAYDKRGVYAFANITRSGHVDFVMCHPRRAQQGAARRVLMEAMAQAQSEGCTKLTTQASLAARPLFETCGFRVEESRNVMGLSCFGMSCQINGQNLRSYDF